MGVVKFCAVFDKPDRTYYPGEMVTGRVELVTNSGMKIRAVELKLKGRAKCKWDEEESYTDAEGRSRTRTIPRKESETYLKNEQILIGGREKFDLPMGEHFYSFSIILPLKIPSSFSGSYGGISYYAKVKIDIPLAFDKTERAGFTVVNPLNLNYFPNLRTPYKNEKVKTFCCLCCASGPLAIIVHLPKTGFALSEPIPITLEIDNASNVAVNAVHVYLKREIRWKADGCHKDEDVKLQKLRLGGVEEGQSHTWSENFTIPPTTFPHLDCCSIIKIDHKLHIEADASGMHSDLDIHIPITIGDIALSEDPNAPIVPYQVQTYPNNMAYNPGMQVPPGGIPMNPIPPSYPSQEVSSYPGQGMPSYPGAAPNPQYPGSPNGPPGPPFLAICPPGPVPGGPPVPGFANPNPYPNANGMPAVSQGYPPSSYPAGGYPPPGQALPVQPYPPSVPSLPPQPATNPEYTSNIPPPNVAYSANNGDLTLRSFDSNIRLENTSFLTSNKEQQNENPSATTPLLPSSPSAPPSGP